MEGEGARRRRLGAACVVAVVVVVVAAEEEEAGGLLAPGDDASLLASAGGVPEASTEASASWWRSPPGPPSDTLSRLLRDAGLPRDGDPDPPSVSVGEERLVSAVAGGEHSAVAVEVEVVAEVDVDVEAEGRPDACLSTHRFSCLFKLDATLNLRWHKSHWKADCSKSRGVYKTRFQVPCRSVAKSRMTIPKCVRRECE